VIREDTVFVDAPSDDDWKYEQKRQERYDAMLEDYQINRLTNGRGLPPDGLIEEWKHGYS